MAVTNVGFLIYDLLIQKNLTLTAVQACHTTQASDEREMRSALREDCDTRHIIKCE